MKMIFDEIRNEKMKEVKDEKKNQKINKNKKVKTYFEKHGTGQKDNGTVCETKTSGKRNDLKIQFVHSLISELKKHGTGLFEIKKKRIKTKKRGKNQRRKKRKNLRGGKSFLFEHDLLLEQ